MKTLKIPVLILALVLIFQSCCNPEDPPLNPTNCDWEFLLEDSEGIPDHLTVSSSYWVSGAADALHASEVDGYLTEAHANPDYIYDIEKTDVGWILDIEWYLLDYANHQVRPDIDAQLDYLATQVAGKEDEIKMFYVSDEPYLPDKEITRQMLEEAIGKVKAKFPGIPTYITYAHNYFFTDELSAPGTQPGSNRGIPNNLDVVSFDWYSNGSDGSSKRNIEELVKPTFEKLKEMNSTVKVLLTGEAYSQTLKDEQLPEAIFRYWDFASTDNQIIGVDHFTWADNPLFQGMTSLPKARAVVKAISKEIRLKRGDLTTDNKIPVYEYLDSHDAKNSRYEFRYDSWFWKNWTKSCYIIKELKFYIPPAGEANANNLYLCYVDKTSEVDRGYMYLDHRLSTDANCGGEKLAKPSKLLGSIFTSQESGTIPLYEFYIDAPGTDHAYSTNKSEYDGVNGYQLTNGGNPIGYVYPVE
jgi:hypothetical protein